MLDYLHSFSGLWAQFLSWEYYVFITTGHSKMVLATTLCLLLLAGINFKLDVWYERVCFVRHLKWMPQRSGS